MVTVDIKSAQQMLLKKVTFGHPKRYSEKIRIVYYTKVLNKNVFFVTLTYQRNNVWIN